VATKTGNIYISGTMTNRIKIPTANLEFLTTPSSKKLPQAIATTIDNANGNIDVLGANLATLGSSYSKIRNLPLQF